MPTIVLPRWLVRCLPVLLAGAPLLLADVAHADTVIVGGNLSTRTWTVAGSPYVIQGDVTIPATATLTVEAGVVVQVSSGDAAGAGVDPSRVELNVNGQLVVAGTPAAPVVFTGSGIQPEVWLGISVARTGSATLSWVNVLNAQTALQAAGQVAVTSMQVTLCRSGITILNGATGTVDRVRLMGTGLGAGLSAGWDGSADKPAALVHVTNVLATGWESAANFSGSNVVITLTNATLVNSTSSGLSVNSGGTAKVRNAILINNGCGVTLAGLASLDFGYSDVWQNGVCGSTIDTTALEGVIAINPFFVATDDFHLMDTSPCLDHGTSQGAPAWDLDGQPRPQDGDFDGTAAADRGL